MAKILLATHNQGKIRRYQALFRDIKGLGLVTLADVDIRSQAPEPFGTPQQNAEHKAREYGDLSQLPTIAIDEAVSTNFLPDHEQPGVFVRRLLKGRELSDREMLTVWQQIFERYPAPERQFTWDFCLAYYEPQTRLIRSVSAVQINGVAERFSEKIDPGYPMSSFLLPPGYDRPYSELSPEEFREVDRVTLRPFCEFIKEIASA